MAEFEEGGNLSFSGSLEEPQADLLQESSTNEDKQTEIKQVESETSEKQCSFEGDEQEEQQIVDQTELSNLEESVNNEENKEEEEEPIELNLGNDANNQEVDLPSENAVPQEKDNTEVDNEVETENAEKVENNDDLKEENQDEDEIKNEQDEKVQSEEPEAEPEPEQPKVETPKIDPDQCRVCTSKENLISIFEMSGDKTIAHYIMDLCHNLRISERDCLPHFICSQCQEAVSIAHAFKIKCETTDKEFRSKLKRSQNKRRAATDYILLDANKHLPPSSSDDEDAIVQDDDDFKVSESDDEPDSDEDDEDFQPKKKKKASKKKKTKKPAPKPKKESKPKKSKPPPKPAPKPVAKPVKEVTTKSGRRSNPVQKDSLAKNVVYIEAVMSSSEEEVVYSKKRKFQEEPSETRSKVTPATVKSNPKGLRPSKKPTPSKHAPQHQGRKRESGGEPTGRDLFRTCAPLQTTHWSDSFSD